MIHDRYYYSILSASDKKRYKAIYDGLIAFCAEIEIPGAATDGDHIMELYRNIGLDNPYIFYVDFSQCMTETSSLSACKIRPIYWYTKAETAQIQQKVQTVLKKMLCSIHGTTEYEKEKSVHDLLIKNIRYNEQAVSNIHQYSPRSNTILGVLFYKTAVCEGIAKVTKLLLNALDIKCIVAVGSGQNREGHAWNIVKIGNRPYHLDVTYDLGLSIQGALRYDYFNLTEKDILKDHHFMVAYPRCTDIADNYFMREGKIVHSTAELTAYLLSPRRFSDGAVYLKIESEQLSLSAAEHILQLQVILPGQHYISNNVEQKILYFK